MRYVLLALVLITQPALASSICEQTRDATLKPHTAAKVLGQMVNFSSQPAQREQELSCVLQLVVAIYPHLDAVDPNAEIGDYVSGMSEEYPKEFRAALKRLGKQDARRIRKLIEETAWGGNG